VGSPDGTNPLELRDIGNPRFLELLEEVGLTHRAKAAGYSGSDNPDTWTNFREAEGWGVSPLKGCLVRMGDKYRRVQNLMRNPANDRVGESIVDTLMDLANYALIAVCLYEEAHADVPSVWPPATRRDPVSPEDLGIAMMIKDVKAYGQLRPDLANPPAPKKSKKKGRKSRKK